MQKQKVKKNNIRKVAGNININFYNFPASNDPEKDKKLIIMLVDKNVCLKKKLHSSRKKSTKLISSLRVQDDQLTKKNAEIRDLRRKLGKLLKG
ncbi:MAG: hypothetical protein ABR980_10850 [Ignavibacteriaceae bacterium]|jgi:hypothetical protein